MQKPLQLFIDLYFNQETNHNNKNLYKMLPHISVLHL